MKSIQIDIDDVRMASSVERAIIRYAERTDDIESGKLGPEFACSGPGSGWQKNYSVQDYAARALADDHGAMAYIDASDGRVATKRDGEIVWSEESVIELVVPSADDALRHPESLTEMVRDLHYHKAESNLKEWRELVENIRQAATALDDIEFYWLEE